MNRRSVIAVIFVSILLPSLVPAPPEAKRTFSGIIEEFLVRRNGEVVLDVRTSNPDRWKEQLLERTAPWRVRLSPDVFRYIVIHEYNRFHIIQLDRDRNVLEFSTAHMEERMLEASGPGWAKRRQKS